MRRLFIILILITLSAVTTPAHAQRDSIAPLVGGTYQTYYDIPVSNRLMTYIYLKDVCPERFFDLNPNIQPETPITYGTPVTLPREESCYNRKLALGNIDGEARLKYYEGGEWLKTPYYSTDIRYISAYEVNNNAYEWAFSYHDVSRYLNICLDDLLAENILWQSYTLDEQLELPDRWFITTLDTFTPTNPSHCYAESDETPDNSTREIEFLGTNDYPMFFVEEYNICPEALAGIPRFNSTDSSNNTIFKMLIPDDLPPCYNEQGQRLSYFDASGIHLETPRYISLEVYYAMPYATLPEIAEEKGVCLVDLLQINGFPELPKNVMVELFIPVGGVFCESIVPKQYKNLPEFGNREPQNLLGISVALNVCPEVLADLNPHITSKTRLRSESWVLIPEYIDYCYAYSYPLNGETVYDIERRINICHEAFIIRTYYNGQNLNPLEKVWYLKNTKTCYDKTGRRLKYHQPPAYNNYLPESDDALTYSDMGLHIFQQGETVYSISRLYNVCVSDILRENFRVTEARPTGYPVFIPDARPCYDETTGLPLIYEDDLGNTLSEPKIDASIRFYGAQPLGRISYYYNVCESKILDANPQQPYNREYEYIGWIIPTDRPPCYQADGSGIDYACYHQNGADATCFEEYSPDNTVIHTLAAGESIVTVARLYDIPTWRLAQANQLDSSKPIWVGQTVIVPLGISQSLIYRLIIAGLAGSVLVLMGVLVFVMRRKTKTIA